MGWGVGYVRMDPDLAAGELTVGAVTYFGSDTHDPTAALTAWQPRVCWLRTDGDESVFLVAYESQASGSDIWKLRLATVAADLTVTYGAPVTVGAAGAGPSLTRLSDSQVWFAYEPAPATGDTMHGRIITVTGSSISVGSANTSTNVWRFLSSANPARIHSGGRLAYVYVFETYDNIYWRLRSAADNYTADVDWWNVHEVPSPPRLHYDPQIIPLGDNGGGEDSLITWVGYGSDDVLEFGACGVRLYPGNTQWRGSASTLDLTGYTGNYSKKFWSVRTGDQQVTLFVAQFSPGDTYQLMQYVTATLDPDTMGITWGTITTVLTPDGWADLPRAVTRSDNYWGALAKTVSIHSDTYGHDQLDLQLLTPGDPPGLSFPGSGPTGNPVFDKLFDADIAFDAATGLGLLVCNEEDNFPETGDYSWYTFGVPFKVA